MMNINTAMNGLCSGEDGDARSFSGYDLDLEKYRRELAEFQLTEEQEAELLQTLWSIMRSFVEMGFSGDACAQLFYGFNPVSGPETEDDKIPGITTKEAMPDGSEKGTSDG